MTVLDQTNTTLTKLRLANFNNDGSEVDNYRTGPMTAFYIATALQVFHPVFISFPHPPPHSSESSTQHTKLATR